MKGTLNGIEFDSEHGKEGITWNDMNKIMVQNHSSY